MAKPEEGERIAAIEEASTEVQLAVEGPCRRTKTSISHVIR